MARLPELLKQEITVRRTGLAIVMLAAVPAIVIPLLACVVAILAPAALIAGIAAISSPSLADRDGRAVVVTDTTPMIMRR